jgi:hypothetical protein
MQVLQQAKTFLHNKKVQKLFVGLQKLSKKLKSTLQEQRLSYLSTTFGGIKPRVDFGSMT